MASISHGEGVVIRVALESRRHPAAHAEDRKLGATSGVDGDPSDPDGGVLGCVVVKRDLDPALEIGIDAYIVIRIGFQFVAEDEQAARKYPGSRIDNG